MPPPTQTSEGKSLHRQQQVESADLVAHKAWKCASRSARQMSKRSRVVNPTMERSIPRFLGEEMVVGKLLGSGGFNSVYELSAIVLTKDPLASENAGKICSENQTLCRTHLATQTSDCEATNNNRFAIKFLSGGTVDDPGRFFRGAVDLVMETKFLASLDHEHIIKLRGMSATGTRGFTSCHGKGYFLILDRLQCSLEDRLDEWKHSSPKFKSTLQKRLLDHGGEDPSPTLADRLQVAAEVASALYYLHERNILYRDLKPDNIGFDFNDTVKLFDFGLAKELDDSFKCNPEDGVYELTGNTGSQRYMAPEVALFEPYNLSADVYSFGILLWEICRLEVPFDGYSRKDHHQYVIEGSERPPLDPSWYVPLRSLLMKCWDPVPQVRPSMKDICNILNENIAVLRRCATERDEKQQQEYGRRRSTFVYHHADRDDQKSHQQQEYGRRRSTFVFHHADRDGPWCKPPYLQSSSSDLRNGLKPTIRRV